MANTIKLKTGSGSDPSASDLIVGEIAIRTDSGKLFTKKDNGSVAEISGSGGGIEDGDKGDITVSNGGDTFTIDNGVVTSAKIADGTIVNGDINASAAIAGSKINPNFGSQDITTTGDLNCSDITLTDAHPVITFTDTDNNPDFRIKGNSGAIEIEDITNNRASLTIYNDNHIDVHGNLDVGAGLDVTGNISCSGTVDGVDIAARNTLFGGLTSSSGVLTNGVTATTQSAGNNTTRVATTAFVSTAISNLINGAPSALDTLNELAAAMNDDAAFSTTVTNSLATKMPLAGGQFTGNITFSGSQTVDGRDLSVDGSKLDGIESNATADQTASEILTLLKTVDGAGSGLDADTLDGISSGSFLRSNAADIMSQGTQGTATLDVRNTGGHGSGTGTGALIAKFVGDSDAIEIRNIAGGDYGIYNSQQDNGFELYDGTGGVRILYNGNISVEFDSGNSYGDFKGVPTVNGTNLARVSDNITGNAATATKLATARNIAGVSFDGSANISLNNNAITNGAGYITSSGTAAGFSAGNASNLNSGTIPAARIGSNAVTFARMQDIAEERLIGRVSSGSGDPEALTQAQVRTFLGLASSATTDTTNASNISSGTISDARLPSSISSDITGNAATATTLATARTIAGVSFNGSANISLNNNAITNGAGYITSSNSAITNKLPLSGGTMTGELQINARLDVGDGNGSNHEIRIFKEDNNVSDHIQFYNGTTRVGEIGVQDTTWLRINQVTNKNIYTPRYIRADNGFFVDGTSKGINGSGNFIGGTIAGASDYGTLLRSNADDTASGIITLSSSSRDCLNFSANSTDDNRGLAFNGRIAISADYNDGYLRLNNASEFGNGVYTPLVMRADNGFQVDSTTVINGSAQLIASRLTGALPAIDGSALTGISAGATGGGSDEVFYENDQTVTTNYTITNGKNAMAAGPITINSGVTVTVGSGETLTIV